MTTNRRNLEIEAGTTFERTLRFFTDKERTQPLDLTGYVMAAWFTRGSFRVEFDLEITDAEEGEAVMRLEPEQTRDVLPEKYVWDMMVRAPAGKVTKYIKGEVTIHPTATRLPDNE